MAVMFLKPDECKWVCRLMAAHLAVTIVLLTRHSSSQQFLQVVSEQQLVAGDFEASTEEEGSTDAHENLIW